MINWKDRNSFRTSEKPGTSKDRDRFGTGKFRQRRWKNPAVGRTKLILTSENSGNENKMWDRTPEKPGIRKEETILDAGKFRH